MRSPAARWVDHDRNLPSDCSRNFGLGTCDPRYLRDFVVATAGKRLRLVCLFTEVGLFSVAFCCLLVIAGPDAVGFCCETTKKVAMRAQGSSARALSLIWCTVCLQPTASTS